MDVRTDGLTLIVESFAFKKDNHKYRQTSLHRKLIHELIDWKIDMPERKMERQIERQGVEKRDIYRQTAV